MEQFFFEGFALSFTFFLLLLIYLFNACFIDFHAAQKSTEINAVLSVLKTWSWFGQRLESHGSMRFPVARREFFIKKPQVSAKDEPLWNLEKDIFWKMRLVV